MTSAKMRQDLLMGIWGLDETSYAVRHGVYMKIDGGWKMAHVCTHSKLYDAD